MSYSATPKDPNSQVLAAAKAIATSLNGTTYAIVGGAACATLGSLREPSTIDIVVPRGETAAARQKFAQCTESFVVEPKTRHTYFVQSVPWVQVVILTPPGLFRGDFTNETKVVERDGIRILHPLLVLDELCSAIMIRWDAERKQSDAEDILFLLKWLVEDEDPISRKDVKNANREFADWFVGKYGGQELWLKVRVVPTLYRIKVA
jgi:hypothetical protein